MGEHTLTTRGMIETWFEEGQAQSYSYMLIVCDRFDYTDYPVYAMSTNVEREIELQLSEELRDVHEVYDLDMDKDDQLAMRRCWQTPSGGTPPPTKGMGMSCGCDLTAEILLTINPDTAPAIVCPRHGVTVLNMT